MRSLSPHALLVTGAQRRDDHAQDDLEEGVLAISIPKKAGAQAKPIAIKTGAKP